MSFWRDVTADVMLVGVGGVAFVEGGAWRSERRFVETRVLLWFVASSQVIDVLSSTLTSHAHQ